jgi:hypothetical protein
MRDLFGFLTILALVLALTLAAVASVFVKRMEGRTPLPISEEIGSAKAVMHKVRKREPMSKDELDYAKQIVADRSSLHPRHFVHAGLLLCIWQSLLLAWSHALRADIPRGDPYADIHEPGHSASQQRKAEMASAENVLKRHKACGLATDRCTESFSSRQHC